MVKGSNNYFNAVPTSDILDSSSNADIPIAETVVAHPLGGGDCSHHISSSADDGGQNVADPSFTIDEDDTMPAAANGKNGNNVVRSIHATLQGVVVLLLVHRRRVFQGRRRPRTSYLAVSTTTTLIMSVLVLLVVNLV
jgi:hypothetical protein